MCGSLFIELSSLFSAVHYFRAFKKNLGKESAF